MDDDSFTKAYEKLFLSALSGYAGFLQKLLDIDSFDPFLLMYRSKNNWFSNSHIFATEVDGEPAALAIALDFESLEKEKRQTKKLFRKIWSSRGVEVFKTLDLLIKNLDTDSYVLFGFAVSPKVNFIREMQEIIRYVSLEPINKGYSNLSIYVEKDNTDAKSILDNFGFEVNRDIELGTKDKVVTVTLMKKTDLMP